MLKHTVKLEAKIGEYEGIFVCDHDSPLPVAKEMLFQFIKHLGLIEDNIKAQAAQMPKTELPTPDICHKEFNHEKAESQISAA